MKKALIACAVASSLLAFGCKPAGPPPKPARTGTVTPLATLQKITLPVPAGVPAGAAWKVVAPGVMSGAGFLQANLTVAVGGADKYWYGFVLRDCRDGKKNETPDLCDELPTEMFAGYPIKRTKGFGGAVFDTMVVGNFLVVGSAGAEGASSVKQADMDAFFKSLDLAGIAKL